LLILALSNPESYQSSHKKTMFLASKYEHKHEYHTRHDTDTVATGTNILNIKVIWYGQSYVFIYQLFHHNQLLIL
jgi:hypothetical protein